MDYSILDYGAVADGITNNRENIQAAIDACSVSGGRVVIPPGRFLSGSLKLLSNVELHLENGAVLISSLNPEDIIPYAEELEGGCFLYAGHEKNVVISGEGIIDGQGRLVYVDDDADNGYHECPLAVHGFRTRMSYLEDVENLTVRGVTFCDSPFWTLHMAGCKNVLVDNIRILNNDRGPNNDGIDPDCCKNVIIRGCIIETGDDAVVVKTTKPMAEKYGGCENVVIHGCVMHSRDSALKIGTETHGTIRNIVLSDCVVNDCSRAVGIWVRDGGTVEDVVIHHITGSTRRYADCPQREFAPRWWGKGEPLFLSAASRSEGQSRPGRIRRVSVDHVRMTSESCIFIGGEREGEIEDITMENLDLTFRMQGNHLPGVFDEQPSLRGVYTHEIPCVYIRHGKNIHLTGRAHVEDSLREIITKRKILEECKWCRIYLEEPDSEGGTEGEV